MNSTLLVTVYSIIQPTRKEKVVASASLAPTALDSASLGVAPFRSPKTGRTWRLSQMLSMWGVCNWFFFFLRGPRLEEQACAAFLTTT